MNLLKVSLCASVQLPDEHQHFSQRAPWLRAGVLGANDGLVSVASLMLGVEGGTNELHPVVLAGVAGLVAGALSMAVGEFVSVSSQRWLPSCAALSFLNMLQVHHASSLPQSCISLIPSSCTAPLTEYAFFMPFFSNCRE